LALWTHREPKPNRSLLNNPGNGTLRIHQILSEDLSFYSCAEAMLGHPEHFGKRPNVGGFLSSAFSSASHVSSILCRFSSGADFRSWHEPDMQGRPDDVCC
jgi:hypothetical protein